MIVTSSAAPICATEAATKEGTGDDFDSETSKMMNTKNTKNEHKEYSSLLNANGVSEWWTKQTNGNFN